MTFDEMRQWLSRHPDLDDAFRQVVDADAGTGGWFQSLSRGQIFSSNGGSILVQRSPSSVLSDLEARGLLRLKRRDSRGKPQYELPADAREFEAWRRGLPSPVEQVEQAVLRLVDDTQFAARHPDAAKHLRAAFDLLAGAPLDVADTTIFGEHLRKALTDAVGVASGLPNPDEQLERVLRPRRVAAVERGSVAVAMLVDLTIAVASLAHSIDHIRDEKLEHRKPADVETMRRAAFLTAVCCYELDHTPLPRPT